MTTEAIGLTPELSDSKGVEEPSSEEFCNIDNLNSLSTEALISNDSSKRDIGECELKGNVDIDISHDTSKDPSDCIDSNYESELSAADVNSEEVRIDLETNPLPELDDQSKLFPVPEESELKINEQNDTPEICVAENTVEKTTYSEKEVGEIDTEKDLLENNLEMEEKLLKDEEEEKVVPVDDVPDSSDIRPEIREDAVENNEIERKEEFDIEEELLNCDGAQQDEIFSEIDHVHEKDELQENSDTSVNIKAMLEGENIILDKELQAEKDDEALTKECVENFEDKLGNIDVSSCENLNKDPISCEEDLTVNEHEVLHSNEEDECMETEEAFQPEAVDECMDVEGEFKLETDVHMEEELLEGKDALAADLPVLYDAELKMSEGDGNEKLNLAIDDVHKEKNVDIVFPLVEQVDVAQALDKKVAVGPSADEKAAAILPIDEQVDVALPLDSKVDMALSLDSKVDMALPLDDKVDMALPLDDKVDEVLSLDEKITEGLPLDGKVDVTLPLDEKVDDNLPLDEEAEQAELPINDRPVYLPEADLLDEDFPADEELDEDELKEEQLNVDVPKDDQIDEEVLINEQLNVEVLKDEKLAEDVLNDEHLAEDVLKDEQLDGDVLKDEQLDEDVLKDEQAVEDIPEAELEEDFQKDDCLDGYLGIKSSLQQTENLPSKIHEEITDKKTEETSVVENSFAASVEDEVQMDISKNDIESESIEDPPSLSKIDGEINEEVGADGLQTDSNLPMEDNSILEDSVQPDDIVAVKDGQSIITSLVDYPSDSEDLSVKNNEPEFEIPKSPAVVVHTPCFEEDAQSSWSIDTAKVPPIKIKQLTTNIDEDSRASSVSQKSATKRPHSDDEALPVFTAEQMFEYRWPADGGEFYLVQEHVSEFLGVKSFKRKYPDCTRRPADVTEKRYLKEKGVVSETQCDLGLTAIRTDDVLELMSKDYPEKYQEYIRVLQERERQKINSKNKEYSTPSIDKNKMNDFVQKAMKATAEFNMHLNQERREERRTSFDMQTFTIHVPANKILKLSKEATKVGKYPVALLPGQFQDYYRPYTSQELKYFPINTVLYGPLKELSTVYTQPSSDGSQSDSEDSCASEGSCCSSSQGTHDSGDSSSGSESAPKVKTENPELHVPTLRIKDRLASTCKVCHGTHERNKEGYSEDLIHCSECGSSGHPSCLDIAAEMCEAIRTYAWQCMDCKTCMLCMDPYDEDKMMFCDKCDRGYHTFCVGLKNLPNGRWICQLCGQCSGCGARAPGPEGSKAQWQQDSSKNTADKKPQLLCLACAKPSKR